MFYDKQIKYLDLYERGEKVQNAGFVRLEAQENKVNIQLRAEKLRHTDTGKVQVLLVGEDKEAVLGEATLNAGRGMLECRDLNRQDMEGGIGYGDMCEICVKLPGERSLRCIIREKKMTALEAATITEDEVETSAVIFQAPFQEAGSMSEQMPPLVPQPQFMPEKGKTVEQEVVPEPELSEPEEEQPVPEAEEQLSAPEALEIPEASGMPGTEFEPERGRRPRVEPAPRREAMPGGGTMPESEFAPEGNRRPGVAPMPREESLPDSEFSPVRNRRPRAEPMPRVEPIPTPRTNTEPGPVLRPIPTAPAQERPNATTKWQQLSNIYPHIRPFEDGRDYLKIEPEDFVVLTKEYYPLVTNSFLKHGYYNYEHLILTREMRKDGEHYYIGVPGNFYDKEKQVAVLFGFESFEGKNEPAKSGDFGYYMIPVEI